MQPKPLALFVFIGVSLLAGCATCYEQGRVALRQGRYDEAASYFQEALARDPDRLAALAGLGFARYKVGALDDAIDALGRVVAKAPTDTEAHLYLGLAYLQKGEDILAEDELNALLALKPEPRLAAQIERALAVVRVEALSEELRSFMVASLEAAADWARDVRELRRALQDSQRRVYPGTGLVLRFGRHRR